MYDEGGAGPREVAGPGSRLLSERGGDLLPTVNVLRQLFDDCCQLIVLLVMGLGASADNNLDILLPRNQSPGQMRTSVIPPSRTAHTHILVRGHLMSESSISVARAFLRTLSPTPPQLTTPPGTLPPVLTLFPEDTSLPALAGRYQHHAQQLSGTGILQ
ncbi:hypothetical protein VUR80DRAFT_7691 [Thermomyces stellatus]